MAWNNSQVTAASTDTGNVSAWNEGNLKSLRLHQIQELINIAKMGGVKTYGDWINGNNLYYGEGRAKYNPEEVKDIERIRQVISNQLLLKPIEINVSHCSLGRSESKVLVNTENWEELKKWIEIFEAKVKLYNDLHGLSTRNIDDEDWRGL